MTDAVPALAIEELEAGYEPGLSIVRGTSLAVQPGEIVAVIGPNGAGKSSLVKAVAGLIPVSKGRTLLFGKDITKRRRTGWSLKVWPSCHKPKMFLSI